MSNGAKTKFGEAFGTYLERRAMTQASVAQATGTSRSYVSQIASGKKPAGPGVVDTMATAIQATEEERGLLHQAAAVDAGFRIDLPDDF